MITRQRKRRHQQKVAYQIKQTLTQEDPDNNNDDEVDDFEDKKISEKRRWTKRKDDVNLKRRESYFTNPSPCLLYTSPSPRDRQKSRMPSSA